MDEDVGMDDRMGSCTVSLDQPSKDESVDLTVKGTFHYSYKMVDLADIYGNIRALPADPAGCEEGVNGAFDRVVVPIIHSGADLKNTETIGKADPCTFRGKGQIGPRAGQGRRGRNGRRPGNTNRLHPPIRSFTPLHTHTHTHTHTPVRARSLPCN